MPMFRKKPVVIEARHFMAAKHTPAIPVDPSSIAQSVAAHRLAAWCAGTPVNCAVYGVCILIDTPEGQMKALPGDWIIKGVKGEFYPCKSDIFEATYEPADNLPPPAFSDAPKLSHMAALAKALGCDSEQAFVGAAMKASGGVFHPEHLAQVWREGGQ